MSDEILGESAPAAKMIFPDYLRAHLSGPRRYLVIWIVTGVACGIVAVVFHQAIEGVFETVFQGIRPMSGGRLAIFYALLLLAPTVGGLLTGWILVRFAPDAAGSGIPQTKVRFFRDSGSFGPAKRAGEFSSAPSRLVLA